MEMTWSLSNSIIFSFTVLIAVINNITFYVYLICFKGLLHTNV